MQISLLGTLKEEVTALHHYKNVQDIMSVDKNIIKYLQNRKYLNYFIWKYKNYLHLNAAATLRFNPPVVFTFCLRPLSSQFRVIFDLKTPKGLKDR